MSNAKDLGLCNDKIVSVERTSGNGAPGTVDTYTITLRSGDSYNFEVTNGSAFDASPANVFPTLSALESAYPTGDSHIYVVSANGHWYYYNNGWQDGGVYQAMTEIDTLNDINSRFVANMIKADECTVDVKCGAIGYSIDNTLSQANLMVSKVFSCQPNETYTILGALNWTNFTAITFAGADKIVTSNIHFTKEINTFTIPENVYYFRVNMSKARLTQNNYFLAKTENLPSDILSYNFLMPNLKLPVDEANRQLNVRVGKTGNVDFTSLTDAIDWINTQTYKQVVIGIYNGTFDAYEESNGENTFGYTFPKNCLVIGYDNVKITLNLPASQANDTGSALNHPVNCEFRNIIFEASNCRYALHDDNWNPLVIDGVRQYTFATFRNCRFIYDTIDGTIGRGWASACGIGANHDMFFYNCYFRGIKGGYSIHSNQSQDNIQGSNIYMYDCYIHGGEVDINLSSYKTSNNYNVLNLHNCQFDSIRLNYNASEYGNDNMLVSIDDEKNCKIVVVPNAKFKVLHSNNTKMVVNNNYNLNIGDKVSLSNNNIVAYTDYLGLYIVTDIDENYVYLKFKGMIPSRYYTETLTNGLVAMVNGSLVNTNDKSIAIGYYDNDLYLY